jgi:hypothetical protein
MIIKVTKADIANGIPASPSNCPIALAAWRATHALISVSNSRIEINGRVYVMPGKAKDFVALFDIGFVPDPLSFSVPYEVKFKKGSRIGKPGQKPRLKKTGATLVVGLTPAVESKLVGIQSVAD